MFDFQISKEAIEALTCCPLCNSRNLSPITRVYHHNGVEFLSTSMCSDCNFVFRQTRPTKEWFSKAFCLRESYQEKNGISAINQDIEKERYQRYLQLGAELFSNYKGKDRKAKVLDIGCGPGSGLKAFEDIGFDVVGLEEDGTRSKYGKDLGLNIITKQWEEFNTTDTFDIITILHAVEHFHEPNKLFLKLRPWLKPDGKLIIEVPNLRYFVVDWTDALYLAHMANYTPSTLTHLARNCQFESVNRLKYYNDPTKNNLNLCMVFGKDGNNPVENFYDNGDEPNLQWVKDIYGAGLSDDKSELSLPYEFEVSSINDISLTYKNSSKISAQLFENLHMRDKYLETSTKRIIVI